MKRNWNMDEVSDGRYYDKEDMVKAGCNGCQGCSACCRDMGTSVILDPYDIYRLTECFSCTMKELLESGVELNMVDGIILPNLKMSGEGNACFYLNGEGRCRIHTHRPGICRLFPLGRIYEKGGFRYFLQVHECAYEEKTEVRVGDWINTPNLKKYEKYITEWHYFLMDWEKLVQQSEDATEKKQFIMYLLMQFFNKPYDLKMDFYPQFYKRKQEAKELAGLN